MGQSSSTSYYGSSNSDPNPNASPSYMQQKKNQDYSIKNDTFNSGKQYQERNYVPGASTSSYYQSREPVPPKHQTRPTIEQCFGPVLLSDILTPEKAASLLGRSTSRSIIKCYRRFVLSCMPRSGSNFQSQDLHELSEDDSYFEESDEESCDIEDVIDLFFPTIHTSSAVSSSGIDGPSPASSSSQISSQHTMHLNWCSHHHGIDKITFCKQMLPEHVKIPTGVMENVFTACTSNSLSGASNTTPHKMHLPDLFIFVAIFLYGTPKVRAAMAFRVYDAHQKRGTITRDTLLKFIEVIYGVGVGRSDSTKRILDSMFDPETLNNDNKSHSDQLTHSNQNLNVSRIGNQYSSPRRVLSEISIKHFLRGVQITSISDSESFQKKQSNSDVKSKKYPSHLLIAWLEAITQAMIPPAVKSSEKQSLCNLTPYASTFPSVTRLSVSHTAATNASLKKQVKKYRLTRMMQFEAKRKFHSLCSMYTNPVQSGKKSSELKQHNSCPAPENNGRTQQQHTEVNRIEIDVESHQNQLKEQRKQQQQQPHYIVLETFLSVVFEANSDMGWGGYLPKSVARLVFMAGCQYHDHFGRNKILHVDETKMIWTFCDAISFACLALREQNDSALLKFCFHMFFMDGILKMKKEKLQEDNKNSDRFKKVLNRATVQDLIIAILDHYSYRKQRDSNLDARDEEIREKSWWYCSNNENERKKSHILVSQADAVNLNLIRKDVRIQSDAIFLDAIVDMLFDEAEEEDELSLEGFLTWHFKTDALQYLLTELRLIGGVLFGIRPATPVMELELVNILKHRFQKRYPRPEKMLRGPDGTKWYILSFKWWKKWNEFVSFPSQPQTSIQHNSGTTVRETPISPSEINNNGLLIQGSLELRKGLKHKLDFVLIPPLVWQALQAWYDGGPPVYRVSTTSYSIAHGKKAATVDVELYPLFLSIALADATTGQARPFQQSVPVSRLQPLTNLVETLCGSLNHHVTESVNDCTRLWKIGKGEDGSEKVRLLDLSSSLHEQKVPFLASEGVITLLLELRNKDGRWPRGEIGAEVVGSPETTTEYNNGELVTNEVGDGIIGLHNMGNTCYLNSSIQCLSHTPLLREYFTSKIYLKDINTTNVFGHQGRLAQVSADLIIKLWKPYNRKNPLTPKSFKDAIGKFNDHFAGNEQHDAQELLSYLLDGLSEDLNRIETKPYIEAPDSDGRPDRELADIWWKNHLMREFSIIVALFTGQYKSLLTCNECHYESARFEPFMYLQLPLPEDNLITISIILFPLDDKKQVMRYSVRTKLNGNVTDVLIELSRILYHDNQSALSGNERKEKINSVDVTSFLDKSEENKLITAGSDNLALVDFKFCEVRSIMATTRRLIDIQSRDTGEMPLLFVYELEPSPISENTKTPKSRSSEEIEHTSKANVHICSNDGIDEKEKKVTRNADKASVLKNSKVQGDHVDKNVKLPHNSNVSDVLPSSRPSYIAVAQRKVEPISHTLMHPYFLRTFSTPLLLRIADLEGYTGTDVYDLIAKRISRYVPGGSLPTLLNLSLKDLNAENDTNGKEKTDFQKKTNDPIENPSIKRSNTPSPTFSSFSNKNRRLRGQRTTIEMETVSRGPIPRHGFRLRITSRDCKSCGLCPWYDCCIGCEVPDDDYPTIIQDGDSIALDWHVRLLNSSHKHELVKQTNKNRSQGLVIDALQKHRTCRENYGGGDITLEECLDAFAKEEKIPEAYCSKCKDFRVSTKSISLWRLPPIMIIHLKRFQFTQHMKRKLRNIVVFPIDGLDFSRIVVSDHGDLNLSNNRNSGDILLDGEDDESNVKRDVDMTKPSSTNDGRSESLYDLYGVIHHQGALSTGHYVASLRSEVDGKWRMYNDAQVSEISKRDLVDASAYILFYVRRDVKNAGLSKFWEAKKDGEGISEEEIDKLTRQRERCIIS